MIPAQSNQSLLIWKLSHPFVSNGMDVLNTWIVKPWLSLEQLDVFFNVTSLEGKKTNFFRDNCRKTRRNGIVLFMYYKASVTLHPCPSHARAQNPKRNSSTFHIFHLLVSKNVITCWFSSSDWICGLFLGREIISRAYVRNGSGCSRMHFFNACSVFSS